MKLLEKPNSHAPSTRRAREKFPPRTTWRAQKSATAKKSREKSTAFFTGKPYIESLGSYSFLFRNYNPALCRWTTPEPSGFPDGANPNIYVNNGATSSFDYEGLWKLKLRGVQHTYTGSSNTTYGTTTSHSFYYVNASDSGFVTATAQVDATSPVFENYDTTPAQSSAQFTINENGNIVLGGSNTPVAKTNVGLLASTGITYEGLGSKVVTVSAYAGTVFSTSKGSIEFTLGPTWARAKLEHSSDNKIIRESGVVTFIYESVE